MTSGIYLIKNKQNNKVYVGSAVDIAARWRLHKQQLIKNTHHNVHLQRAYNKYGSLAFEWVIYLETSIDNLLIEEQNVIDKYLSYDRKVGYNICCKAGSSLGVIRSAEYKEKSRLSRLGDKSPRFGIKCSKGTLEKCRQSKLGAKNPMYGKPMKESSKAKSKQTFLEKYGKFPNKGKTGKLCKISKPICQFTLQGNFIKQWHCAYDAIRELQLKSTGKISENARGKRKTAYDFIWRYVSDIPE